MARKIKKAFTLVEVLVVIAILIILFSFSSPFLIKFNSAQDLNSVTEEMVSVIRTAEVKSINGEMGLNWGVAFVNPGSFYLFNDNGLVENYQINPQINLQPTSPNLRFIKLTGQLLQDFTMVLTRDNVSYKIEVNQEGMINYYKQ
jgi:prepilin-type N-terminal cleavage/methylation domain-containing protein